jgi:hypothetical protein
MVSRRSFGKRSDPPFSDTEALIYGLGRGRGETVKIIERNGDEFTSFSRYEYKKNKKG